MQKQLAAPAQSSSAGSTTASTSTPSTPPWLSAWKDGAQALQASVAVLAMVIGAIWTYKIFVQHRQKYPRANVTLRVDSWCVGAERRLIHTSVCVANVGETLVELASGLVRLQQVLPMDAEIAGRIARDTDPVSEGECEVLWPQLRERQCQWGAIPREIEPGETDEYHFDFVIPAAVRVIEVYSYLQNVKKRKRNIGWNTTSVYTCTIDDHQGSAAAASTSPNGSGADEASADNA
jgi:flagellar biogenesis protein FliO